LDALDLEKKSGVLALIGYLDANNGDSSFMNWIFSNEVVAGMSLKKETPQANMATDVRAMITFWIRFFIATFFDWRRKGDDLQP
jgi:hypothetical protein